MKISTRARYGMRAMVDLAAHYRQRTVLLKDIAKRQGISERYLENIMRAFVAGGLVHSVRGRSGGFALAKPPEEISLSDVVQAVEGSFPLVKCVDNPESCKRTAICASHDIWKKLREAMMSVLGSTTLQDMVEIQKRKVLKLKTQMYYI
ncbi:MAG: Rrf2 family transcriptional regulator [Caldiserica bacterium]|nr:Rrf2 family transcriptional regulator [Caldisericota bacterium]